MTVDRLGQADAEVLDLESGKIAGHTCKIVIVERRGGERGIDALREHVASRLDLEPRLRMRLGDPGPGGGPPLLKHDEQFDITRHVRAVEAAGPVSMAGLDERIAEAMSARLDRTRPLWRIDLVPDLDGGRAALIWLIHHALADGATAMRIAGRVIWDGSSEESRAEPPETLTRTEGRRWRWRRAAALAARVPGAIARELLPRSSASPLAGTIGHERRVAFARAPLDELRAIEHAAGPHVTVNDVVLAAVTGGVHEWLTSRHTEIEKLRVKIPVRLHRPGEGDAAANRDSFLFCDLPLAADDPSARLRAISRETSERKSRHDADTIDAVNRALGRLGPAGRLAGRLERGPRAFALSVSNIRGPSKPVAVLGNPVTELRTVAEIAPHHALRVAAISCGGTVTFGLCADAGIVPDVGLIADGIEREIVELSGP